MGMVKRCCGRAQQRKGEFMIRITQLKLSVGHTPEQLKKKIAKTLKCAEDTFSYEIVRQSLDARHKDDKKFVYTVDVKTAAEQKILRRVHNNNIMSINNVTFASVRTPAHAEKTFPLHRSPVSAGRGRII